MKTNKDLQKFLDENNIDAEIVKVEKITGETVNTASPDEVLNYTKYKAGGVPPISTGVKTIIDENVLKLRECYAGGGTDTHLIKMNPQDIKKYSNGIIGEIKK